MWLTVFTCLGSSSVAAEELGGTKDKLKDLAARKIEEGLRPHHATGSRLDDPLLRKHRFQLHDFETDHLTYYEYEARLHAHVVMLEDLAVVSCNVRPMAENHTSIALVMTANAKLEKVQLGVGSIVVGEVNCTAVMGSAEKRWVANLQERIVEEPVLTKLDIVNEGSVKLSIVTKPVQMHECFESSQLEFFRGKTHAFEEARMKRHASFASKGESAPSDNFTDAVKVIAEAKAAERALNRALAAPRREQQHRNTSRRLSHKWWETCKLGPRFDFQLELIGKDCGDNVNGGDDCYWKRGSDYLLRPGGRYKLRWDGYSDRSRVYIGLYENDYTHASWKNPASWFNGDDWCSTIPFGLGGNDVWHRNDRGYPNVNQVSFTMPDWSAIQRCADGDGAWGTGG